MDVVSSKKAKRRDAMGEKSRDMMKRQMKSVVMSDTMNSGVGPKTWGAVLLRQVG